MSIYNRALSILFSIAALGISCRNDDESPRIEKLEFHENIKTVKIGENAVVGIKVSPESARNAERIKYSTTGQDIIEIDDKLSSNSGVVFTAKGGGSAVITAQAQGIVDYLSVSVEGTADTGIPYITVTDTIIEIPLGTKKHFMSTLQNGSPNDNFSFVFSNRNKDIINYETANNTAVIEGLRPGSDIITIKHPKAQYGVDVLVFVLEQGENAKYITGENVVFLEAGKAQAYHTRLVGIGESEKGYSVYQIIEGGDVITASGSGESCYITAKKEGVAKIRVTNRSAPYPFEFQVIARGKENSGYIRMSSNFVILEDTSVKNIYAHYIGDAPADIDEKYRWSFENNVNDIADVIRYGNNFAIKALKNGNVKLIIENEYSPVRQEVLVQVQFEKVTYGEMIITTSQNVIYMEMGAVDVILKMKLVGGNQADKNNFEWVVEDSSIIGADIPAGHGTAYHRAVTYKNEVTEAEAKITAKKAGTTYITVTNTSAPRSEVRVLVKVYPKGMFSGNTVSLGGPGLLTVQRGKTLDIGVHLLSGSYQNTGDLAWHINDGSIAGVESAGLSGILTGCQKGVTKLVVSGQNVVNEYHAVVVVYEEGQEELMPYIFTDRLQYKMYAGQSVWVYIGHPNIKDEVFDFTIMNTGPNVVYTNKLGSVIIINAVEPGEAELIVNTGIPDCNIITITVSVELAEINTERPYTITGDSSALTYVGGTVEYQVLMAGAPEADKSKITWTIDDSSIASLEMANGTNVVLRGLKTGQTVLRAESVKSANVKEVVVFVTATQSDTNTKITLGLSKINYILQQGDSFFAKIVTNATENQKLQIRWSQSDADILAVEDNYDTAFITALEEGTCIITIDTRDSSHVMPLVLYVTVRSPVYDELQIGFPSSVTLVKGQSKIIKGNVLGGGIGGHDFLWNLEDDNVAHVIGNGLEATLWGRNAGQSFLTVSHYGFSKKILVICVENVNNLEDIFYFTSDKTYFRIKKNEEARVNLLFGENGFSEDEKKKIVWKEDLNNNVISLSSSGESAKITGKNSGVARIIASHDKVHKDVEILIEVVESVTGSQEYYMLFPTVNRMVSGVPQTIPISLYKDEHLYTQGYSLLAAETEGKGVVQAELLNDTLRVLGRKEGREYITLFHPLAGQRRMLAVVYEEQIPDDEPVIYAEKQYWSVYEGKSEFIELQIAGGGTGAEGGISWANFDPLVISVDSSMEMRAKVTGLSFGSTEIDILFNGNLVEKLYVSVAKRNVDTDVVVSTESIIIMALDTDTRHLTKAIGGGNVLDFEWSIENKEIAEIYGFADQCVLYPVSAGVTELTLGGYNYERKIIVVVVNTEKEKMEARYLNMDKRYFKLKRGESTVIYPYYKTAKPGTQANDPSLLYNSGVVGVAKEGEGFVVTGKNEGIEIITIANSQCENSIRIAVEVSNVISGGVVENNNLVYMTTENNIIMARPGTYGLLVKIDVIGEYQGANSDFIWSKDSILIGWEASGTLAFINTKDKTGEVNITVENNYCKYPLKIKVIIQEDYEIAGSPYVYADRTVYRLTLTDDALRASFKVNNVDMADYSQVVFTKTGNAVDFSLNGSYFEARPRTQGVSEVEVRYPGAVSLKLFFIVSDSVENTAVYLTTAMNYVVVPKSKTKVIDVSLINYKELNADNIKWYSSNFNTVTVVGTGTTVQAYGVEIGFAKLTVKHPASYNDLEILIKVVDELDLSNIAYLTTSDNIIETFVQNNTLQVSVEKIGGKLPELETVWTVDNPSIVSVMGSGNIGYLVPKKTGIAKITVTERETEKLDIVVIVREVKAGTEYIATSESVVQINPGVLNRTIQVRLVGGNELDSQQFEWQIYSQLPSDYEVAKNGGTVISLFGMGDRAAISGNYVGTARIRVSHPKAQLPLYIAVQVTSYGVLSFNEKEAVILNGEIYFAGIRVPNYENFTGKVEYTTDNPAVCVVTGSDKVALLQSQGVGRANITAAVRGTSLQASIEVLVIERDNFAEPNIIVPKTTYLLNPRERPFQVEAYLQGAGVTEEMRHGIKWEAMSYNGTDHGSVWDAIAIYPSETAEKPVYSGGENIKILRGTGPIIQIEVLNPALPEGQTFTTKEIVIVVSQPEITSRTKTIYIRISEISGIFTLNKSEIMMETFDTADLSCNIRGGKDSDYKEVVWVAETDSVGRKIVSLLSDKGKDTRLYGQNDGTVYVTAIYRNEIAECRVQVKSNVYLKLQYETFFTYPGARNGNNQLIEVEYEVRPFTAQITWTPRGTVSDSSDKPVAIITPVTQDYSTGKGKITIDPLSEYDIELVGFTNKDTARMLIIIKNVYRLQISDRILDMQPGYETKYKPEPKPGLYWDYDSKYNRVPEIVGDFYKIGDSVYLPFVICPPDHRLVFNKNTVQKMEKYGIAYEISPIAKYGEMEGRGIIKLAVNREIPVSEYDNVVNGMILELDLKKPLDETVIDSFMYSSNLNSPNNRIFIKSLLPKQQTALIPVFQRVSGKYSNQGSPKYKFYAGNSLTNNYLDKKTLTDDSMNKDSPNAFDIKASNWENNPTGVLGEFNNATWANSTSEYIPLSKNGAKVFPYHFSDEGNHSVSYELKMGDGEEHYLLLDKTHEGMYFFFEEDEAKSAINAFNEEFKRKDFYKGYQTRAPTAELVEINGSPAIRIRGGDDFVVYDRVLVKNRRKISMIYYSPTENTVDKNTDVSLETGINNVKADTAQFMENIGDYNGATDYYLVKRFGIPLNTTKNDIFEYDIINTVMEVENEEGEIEEEIINEYIYKDESALKNGVVNQIVYLRKTDMFHPIRVQYDYAKDLEDNVICAVSVIGNEGGPVEFTNAKDFFNDGPLYVSKAGTGGTYWIKDKTPIMNQNQINGYATREQYYSNNKVVSNINAAYGIYNPQTVTHEMMLEYNPHFENDFNESLYIVSDFDLGDLGIMYYIGFPDYVHIRTYPSSYQEDSTMSVKTDWAKDESHRWDTQSNYLRYLYRIYDAKSNKAIGNNYFQYHHDYGIDGTANFLNLNNGRINTGYDASNGRYYHMYMNDNSLFNNLPEFKKIAKNTGSYHRGSIGVGNMERNRIDSIVNVNYRAILEALRHNGIFNLIDPYIKYTLSSFTSKINGLNSAQKSLILGLLANEHGNTLGGYRDTLLATVSTTVTNQYGSYVTTSEVPKTSYKRDTVYVKREREENHNKIYGLNDFNYSDNIFQVKMNAWSGYYNREIITEDITGDNENYAPIVTETVSLVNNNSERVALLLKYKNSYGDFNTVTIHVTHEIRSNHNSGINEQAGRWDDLKAVKEVAGISNTSFFKKLYGYFFIDNKY
jgi:hypothetical protein